MLSTVCFHTAASTILLKLSLKPPMASYHIRIKSKPYYGLILPQLLLWPEIHLRGDTSYLSLLCFNQGSLPVDQTRQRICLQCRRPGFDSWVRKIPEGKGEGNSNPLQCFVWKISRTEETGRLVGSQIAGHDWVMNTHTHTHSLIDQTKQYSSSTRFLLSEYSSPISE